MRVLLLAAAACAALLAPACRTAVTEPVEPPPPRFPDEWHVVDLTRPLDVETPYLPVERGFPFERIALPGRSAGRVTGAFSATDLLGTHVETPSVFGDGDARVDRIPVSSLALPLVIIDAPPRLVLPGGREGPAATGLSALYAHEARYGTIPAGALVLLRTGEGDRTSRDLDLAGRSPEGGLRSAGWSIDAVRFLARERRARAIGTDTLLLDPGADAATSPAAREAARIGLLMVHGLANLGALPRRGAVAVLGVLPVAGAPSAPARVIALVPPAPPQPHQPGTAPERRR